MEDPEGWAGLYKLLRMAVLALALVAVAVWIFRPSKRKELERPAQRMMEDDDT